MNLTPEQIRDENFESLKQRLPGDCAFVLGLWRQHGPGTTEQVAARANYPLLTLRPRTTDLVDTGAVMLTGRQHRSGIYRARTEAEWEQWHAALKTPAHQEELALA